MNKKYRAMQIVAPGVLEMTERPIPAPGPDEVLVRIEACGVCGADLRDAEKAPLAGQSGRIPGHEIVGFITRKGNQVPDIWQTGQRVGIGRLGGYCQHCNPCRSGLFQLCENQLTPGLSCDGGYAEYIVMRHTALIAIPSALSAVHAAPILCAGTATFNALRNSGARAGDRVAVLGLGGLGHMAVQYARKMGFEVTVIARGSEKEQAAFELGAHHYINILDENASERLKNDGGVDFIVATAPASEMVSALMSALAPRGKAILLGTGKTPLLVTPGMMIGAERTLTGSFVSTPLQTERALQFSHLFQALPVTERLPFERANEALSRLKQGLARYRIVLTMNQDN
ncbi:alcohol dehydrogenase catalytic domain-containing protein [Enterobacter kobei]|uniref:alcohol dehydrogenase catalytic domain-containing protein n=1 Tax=Enterobacter kobei TaxID=208224 RepID=UPI002006A21E|nr:alcohol dehydrogenase catalytic domain-containing protein [Enterobacter kobei]MCK6956796.1 alcohol dehydrogenase catalytic domain-containing protein [Enterobacter kobei]MCK7343414.1 alcohol dehydrogenase catalytic domain-containing protein [Enterobacter kobei]